MGRLAEKVLEDRLARDAIRSGFDDRLTMVRADLEARSVGGRIADKVSEEAFKAFEEAKDVAGQNKGVIAGTIATLALWFLRNPIIALVDRLVGEVTDFEGNTSDDGK